MISRPFVSIIAFSYIIAQAAAQTSSTCSPLESQCPPDTALGKSVTIDFTSGASDSFTADGNPTYDSDGAAFSISQDGQAPTLTSDFYLMFGHVEFTLKPAPGTGIVSSAVMISDDLDEIDFEWLGGDSSQVQSNYFGKGQTPNYNRGAFHADPNNQANFHTYGITWTADQIVWEIDGTAVRTLTPETAQTNSYPQTPMKLKVGAWVGGDSSNAPGVIGESLYINHNATYQLLTYSPAWAGGLATFGGAPYTMHVKSILAEDYSTGSQYSYGDNTGSWQSIKSNGGSINGNGDKAAPVENAPPAVTGTSNSPVPFEGTHRNPSTTVAKPNEWPWVATTMQTSATSTATTYPGLPAGWTVGANGHVYPPKSASVSES